jgi:hypothetical protein
MTAMVLPSGSVPGVLAAAPGTTSTALAMMPRVVTEACGGELPARRPDPLVGSVEAVLSSASSD